MKKLLLAIAAMGIFIAAIGILWFLGLSEDASLTEQNSVVAATPSGTPPATKKAVLQPNQVQELRYLATVTATTPHIALANFKRALDMHRDWRCEPNPDAIDPGKDRLPAVFTLNLPKKQFMALQGELLHLGSLKMTTEPRMLPRATTYVQVRVTIE